MTTNQNFLWPNGKKIAVSVNIMFEAWTEGEGPKNTAQTTPVKAGIKDTASLEWGTYGGRVGVWKLLSVFDKLKIPATFFTSARCVELYPEAVKQIVRSGYDLAGHAYAQNELLTYVSLDEQKALIHKCINMLQDCAGGGFKVSGWGCPGQAFTPETNGYLAQEGLKWHTDVTYTDLPLVINTPHGDIAGVPTGDYSDLRVLKSNPWDFYDSYKGIMDVLQEQDSMSMIVLVLHTQAAGRPIILAPILESLRYIAKSSDVWFTCHKELAQWALGPGRNMPPYPERFFALAARGAGAK